MMRISDNYLPKGHPKAAMKSFHCFTANMTEDKLLDFYNNVRLITIFKRKKAKVFLLIPPPKKKTLAAVL